jgi:hypothetical protein
MAGLSFGSKLFLTILVFMLANTATKVCGKRDLEVDFRRAMLTFEGVQINTIFT